MHGSSKQLSLSATPQSNKCPVNWGSRIHMLTKVLMY